MRITMTEKEFITDAKRAVLSWEIDHLDCTDDLNITLDDIYTVWYCKTLQNAKGLFSTTNKDGMYFEVTYNGDKGEFYLDAYKKFDNKCLKTTFGVTSD